MKLSAVLVVVLASGCTPMTPAKSSSAVLIPERSWVLVSDAAEPTMQAAVRMFTERGYPLVDVQHDARGTVLRFKGERTQGVEQVRDGEDVVAGMLDNDRTHFAPDGRLGYSHTKHYVLGSVFYVRVEPRDHDLTWMSAVGRPTQHGVEACTDDPTIKAPCRPLEAGPDITPEIAGVAEADVINGVFAQLRLAGVVVAPDAQLADRMHHCQKRRREVEAAAARVENDRAKVGIMRTAPDCTALAKQLASSSQPVREPDRGKRM